MMREIVAFGCEAGDCETLSLPGRIVLICKLPCHCDPYAPVGKASLLSQSLLFRWKGRCGRFLVRHGLLALLGGLAAFSAASAWAQAPLTLTEAQRRAVERSRQLVGQDSAITASREMAVAAGQLPDPVATLGVNNLPINGPDAFSQTRDFMTMSSVC